MKKLLIIALALVTVSGFAQVDKEKVMMERLTRKSQKSPEERAQIETKQLTLKLDLTEKQQSQVEETLVAHHAEGNAKMAKNKKAMKEMSDDERHKLQVARLDAQIALKEKMKGILNAEQYAKYSQMMERKMKRGKGTSKKMKKG